MKILIIGDLYGHIDVLNKYVQESSPDMVFSAGSFGIRYRSPDKQKNIFYRYLEGRDKFSCPIYCIRGSSDNLTLWKLLSSKRINIDNFYCVDNGDCFAIENVNRDCFNNQKFYVSGIGGTYSEQSYMDEKLIGNKRKHFNYKEVDKVAKSKPTIILMHNLIGSPKKKEIEYSNRFLELIRLANSHFCIAGGYGWWGHSDLLGTHLIILPKARDGYLLLDSETWNAHGVNLSVTCSN